MGNKVMQNTVRFTKQYFKSHPKRKDRKEVELSDSWYPDLNNTRNNQRENNIQQEQEV